MLICLKNQATFVSFFPNEAELKTHISYYPGYWFEMCFKPQVVLVDLEIIDIFICRVFCTAFFFTDSCKKTESHVFLLMFSLDLRHKVSHSLLSHVWDCISTIWHGNVLAHVKLFHCPRHRVSYYFPHSFCTLAFSESVSAQSESPPAWRLTFQVKEPYCWFLIPLHPPLHKTMVSIASTEYIHSSEWETDWPGLLGSLPAALPGSQANLVILSDSSLLPADSSSGICANIISVAWEPWSWLHCHLVNAEIMACVYIYFPGETVEQISGFDVPPIPQRLNEWSPFYFPSFFPGHCH